jgi:hypothetical protein
MTTATQPTLTQSIDTLRPFIGLHQMAAIYEASSGEEGEHFKTKLADLAALVRSMPQTYDQDGLGMEAIAYLHYFRGGMDWYITERDMESDQYQAFGLADLGAGEPELGYINIAALRRNRVELDLYWSPKPLSQIENNQLAA